MSYQPPLLLLLWSERKDHSFKNVTLDPAPLTYSGPVRSFSPLSTLGKRKIEECLLFFIPTLFCQCVCDMLKSSMP